MQSEWTKCKLGDIVEINTNSYGKNDNWEFVNYLDTGNITENKIDEIQYLNINEDKIPSRAKRKVIAGDIVYSTVRPNQKHFGIIKNPLKNMLVSTGFSVIRSFKSLSDTNFIYWFLSSDSIVEHLHKIGEHSTSTYPAIKPSDIEHLELLLPPLPEQKAIAHILGSLDDKIELNRKMNETLEAMAQAMFKRWFIDFDPVLDNAILAGNPIPEELSERAEIRRAILGKNQPSPSLSQWERNDSSKESSSTTGRSGDEGFPSEFIHTDKLGWIPKGWEVKNSEELFDVKDGTHDSPKQAESGKYLITSRHITGETIDFSKAYLISDEDFEQVNRRSKVDTFDTLLTMIGTVGEPFLVMKDEINFAIKNIGLFKTSVDKKMAIFFYLYLKTTFMKNFFESRMAGTTQKYLTLKILRTLPVLSASSDIMELFGREVIPAFEKIHANNKNISELSKLRDTLLPKLLSGKIRIPDAETMVENMG